MRKINIPTNDLGKSYLSIIFNKIQNSIKNNEFNAALLNAALGNEIRASITNWKQFVNKYQIVAYCDNVLESASKIKLIFIERDNGFERDFKFTF